LNQGIGTRVWGSETQILLAEDLGYLDREKSSKLLQHTAEVGKILHDLLRSLRNNMQQFD
jgi:hypothetical protein